MTQPLSAPSAAAGSADVLSKDSLFSQVMRMGSAF